MNAAAGVRGLLGVTVVGVIGLVSACDGTHAPPSRAACDAQYPPTALYPDLARDAIALANLLLGSDGDPLVLVTDSDRLGSADAVPVYWTGEASGLSQALLDMMFVVDDCAGVVVQPLVFLHWLESYTRLADGSSLLDVPADQILAYFLLHEVGHLRSGHQGRAISARTDQFNTLDTHEKQREVEADEFAARVVRTAAQASDAERAIAATWLSVQLSSLAFNLQGQRSIDHFAGTELALPELFQDAGLSHPSFELRVLRANFLIDPSDGNRELLEHFLDVRERSATWDRVLWRADEQP